MVAEGQTVAKDQPLLVLEAMKMEQTMKAPKAGTVVKLNAVAGDQVADGTLLVQIDSDD